MTKRHLLIALCLVAAIVFIGRVYWQSPPGEGANEIVLMYPSGNLTGAVERVVAEFEAENRRRHEEDPSQPLWKVIAGQHAERNGVARFVLATSGAAAPDVYFAERATSAEWIARGAFRPLDDFYRRDREVAAVQNYPGCRRSVTCYGRIYGVPLGLGNTALLYNKTMLEAAGLVHSDGPMKGQARPPETWNELRDAARRLTVWESESSRRPRIAGFLPLHGAGSLGLYTAAANSQSTNVAETPDRLDRPEAIRALRFIVDLHEDMGGVAAVRSMDLGRAGSPADPFITGHVAMKVDYQWVINWQAAFSPGMRFGVAPMPGPAGPSQVSWATGWQVSIPTGAKNPEGAWALIRFLSSERGQVLLADTQRRLTEANGRIYVPTQTPVPAINEVLARRYVRENAKLPPDVREGFDRFGQLLEGVEFPPVSAATGQIAAAQARATERALFGEVPETALADADRSVQNILSQTATPRGVALPAIETLLLGSVVFIVLAALLFAFVVCRTNRENARAREGEVRAGLGYMSPWLLGFLVLTAAPIALSLLLSFCDFDAPAAPRWTFFANYRELFLDDAVVRRAATNTLTMFIVVPVSLALSLAIALLIHAAPGRSLWQALFYLPVIVPLTASAAAWAWFLNARGPLNQTLQMLGLAGPDWLNDPWWSKPAVALVMLWGCGGSAVVWLAGLQSVPAAQYEAAMLDGAGSWSRFWHVTRPHLRPAFRFNLLAGLMMVLNSFGEAYIMTAGGPNQSSLFLNQHLFDTAFGAGRMGAACALAWILFLAAAVLTALQFRLVFRSRPQS